MIQSTITRKRIRSEVGPLQPLLEDLFRATPLYLFATGLVAAFRNGRR